jgi:hypothetical protein
MDLRNLKIISPIHGGETLTPEIQTKSLRNGHLNQMDSGVGKMLQLALKGEIQLFLSILYFSILL